MSQPELVTYLQRILPKPTVLVDLFISHTFLFLPDQVYFLSQLTSQFIYCTYFCLYTIPSFPKQPSQDNNSFLMPHTTLSLISAFWLQVSKLTPWRKRDWRLMQNIFVVRHTCRVHLRPIYHSIKILLKIQKDKMIAWHPLT